MNFRSGPVEDVPCSRPVAGPQDFHDGEPRSRPRSRNRRGHDHQGLLPVMEPELPWPGSTVGHPRPRLARWFPRPRDHHRRHPMTTPTRHNPFPHTHRRIRCATTPSETAATVVPAPTVNASTVSNSPDQRRPTHHRGVSRVNSGSGNTPHQLATYPPTKNRRFLAVRARDATGVSEATG
jgi:hypothetical protein